MRCDRHVRKPASLVREHYQHEEKTVGAGWDDEEIGGHDLRRMIREERSPIPRWWAPWAHDVFRHSG